jgi:RNA polymerase primary sigma factor
MSFEELHPEPEHTEANLAGSVLAEVISIDEVLADRTYVRGIQEKRTTPVGVDALDPVRSYLGNIGQFPLLEASDEVRLAQIIEKAKLARERLEDDSLSSGDSGHPNRQLLRQAALGDTAKEIFITSNLRLVVSIAKRRNQLSGMEFLDVVQEGNVGLNRAVEKFDWRKGYKFSTYATYWIKQAIGRGIDNQDMMIRLPGNVAVDLRSARRGVYELGTPMSDKMQEISELSMIESLDYVVDGGTTEVVDLLPDTRYMPEDPILAADDREYAESLLELLPPMPRAYLQEYFGFNDAEGTKQTYEKMAVKRNLSREMIRRYVKSATLMLKDLVDEMPEG